jgi:hypothetical protein
MTARLMFPWSQWVHRRVDRVVFSDEDALLRDVSIDFTLPHWFHNVRNTSSGESKRQLVPLGFFRKEALNHFSLRDEHYASLPLLTAPQTSQIAEAVLLKLAELSLGQPVPSEIRHDLHALIYEGQGAAAKTWSRLFSQPDRALPQREALKGRSAFHGAAAQFRDGFLALTMINIRHHERRVVHFSFEEQLGEDGTLIRMLQQAFGQPRRVLIGIMAPSSAASYHLEVEAPDGLAITDAWGYHYDNHVIKPVPAVALKRRAHYHFTNAPPRSRAGAELSLYPRRSSVVRAATLTAGLTVFSTLAIAVRFAHIEQGDNAAAAALLLAVTGIVGLIVVRSGEEEMATTLLLPLRVLAVTPAIMGVLAAIVVVIDPVSWFGYAALWTLVAAMVGSTSLLVWNWIKMKQAGS